MKTGVSTSTIINVRKNKIRISEIGNGKLISKFRVFPKGPRN